MLEKKNTINTKKTSFLITVINNNSLFFFMKDSI